MCGCSAGRRKAELVIIDPEKRSGDAAIQCPRYAWRQPKLQPACKTVLCEHIDVILSHWDRRQSSTDAEPPGQIRSEHFGCPGDY